MNTGLGIRPELFDAVFTQKPNVGFLEAHSENYFGTSIARAKLLELRKDYPLSLHGVGLSLGRADSLDRNHLEDLKQLMTQMEPIFVSEHLAWSAYSHRHVPDLLPLPLTDQSFKVMCDHIDQMQSELSRQVLIENPSNYLLFDQLQIPESEFLNALAKRTGCGLLVDVNNIYVSSINLNRSAQAYINQLDTASICQYHLAGYTEVYKQGEKILIDTHNHTVYQQVWDLFSYTLERHGSKPTLVEWDSDFPEFSVLLSDCQKADNLLKNINNQSSPTTKTESIHLTSAVKIENDLAIVQEHILNDILSLETNTPIAVKPHQHRIWIYQNNAFGVGQDYLKELYPAACGVVGKDFFKQMVQTYIETNPPEFGNIHLYGHDFINVLGKFPSLRDLPYLSDLICFEWALHKAYFSSLGDLLEPNSCSQEELLHKPIDINPSVSLIESKYPISEIHRQSLPDFSGDVSIELNQSEDSLLIYKLNHVVKIRSMNDQETEFIHQLEKFDNLLQAIDALSGSFNSEEMSSNLSMVLSAQLLVSK